jgi:hypothetical protein
MRQFHARAMRPELRAHVDALTAKVNLDCVHRMEAILDFASSSASDDAHALEDFTEQATRDADAAGKRLEAEVEEATLSIVRAVESPWREARKRVPAWQAISAAAVAMAAPLVSDCKGAPPPPDPLPVPTLVSGPPDAAPEVTTDASADTRPSATTEPTIPPMDPLPPPTTSATRPKYPPPPDPLPPPTTRKPKYPPPPDPLPPPTTLPPPDPPPPPTLRILKPGER